MCVPDEIAWWHVHWSPIRVDDRVDGTRLEEGVDVEREDPSEHHVDPRGAHGPQLVVEDLHHPPVLRQEIPGPDAAIVLVHRAAAGEEMPLTRIRDRDDRGERRMPIQA